MSNSRYDFHKEEEKLTDPRFNRGSYIIVRVDGDKFHRFSSEHNFDKPNDKRALDLMVSSAKNLMRVYKGQIVLAYGHSDEFSFLIKSTSNLLGRRMFKITSMLPVIFGTFYNSNWDVFFGDHRLGDPTKRKYDAWFDARPKEYPNYRAVIDYFRWRQIDCHINNLYNTTLHALTGKYKRYEYKNDQSGDLKITCINEWIKDKCMFFPSNEATQKLSGAVSSQKHDIMFLDYKINYNNELEQFKKGTVVVDTQADYNGKNENPDSIKHFFVDLCKDEFWNTHKHIFEDYVEAPPLK